MQPLTEYPKNALQEISFVLTDIDDTLTELADFLPQVIKPLKDFGKLD